MDEIIKALLSGAEDATILRMLEQMEAETGAVKEDEEDGGIQSSNYVSCVKVNGDPILPPVMTDERRLESLMWKRKALEVEERIAGKRRDQLSRNINNIFSTILDGKPGTEKETTEMSDENSGYSVDDYKDDDHLNVYDIIRSNSRAADDLIHNLDLDDEKNAVNIQSSKESEEISSPRKDGTISPSLKCNDTSNDDISVPKSFEEVKKLAKCLPPTPRSARSQPRYLKQHRQVSPDLSDTEDDATSIRTEVADDEDVQMFSLRSVISRTKDTYNHDSYQERRERSNMYDSLVSVNTVIENTDFKDEDSIADREEVVEPRGRKGSYSLSKPSPVLLAYIERMGGDKKTTNVAHNDQSVEDKENVSPNIINKGKQPTRYSPPSDGKKEILQKYLESLSQTPPIIKSVVNKKVHVDEQESLTLDLRELVTETPTPRPESSVTNHGGETFRTDETRSRTVSLPEVAPVQMSDDVRVTQDSKSSRPPPPDNTSLIHEKKIEETRVSSNNLQSQPQLASPECLQAAVSSLARRQQESLNQLIRAQEEARQRLREEFQKQQQMLMTEIFTQFPNLKVDSSDSNNEAATEAKLEAVEAAMERSLSVISGHDLSLTQEMSVTSTISESTLHPTEPAYSNRPIQQQQLPTKDPSISANTKVPVESNVKNNVSDAKIVNNSPMKREGTFTKLDNKPRARVTVKIPEEVYSDKHKHAWSRLTAMGKGFLTRQLLKSEKVQMLKMTIKETVSCAVQLHLESEGPPSQDDLQLHSRLLKQIEAACLDIHNIFFQLRLPDQMTIIAQARAARRERMIRSQAPAQARRLSSATQARLRARNSPPKLETWSDRRAKAVKESRQLSLRTGQLLARGLGGHEDASAARVRRSPRVRTGVRKMKTVTNTNKLRQSPNNILSIISPYAKKNKPVWK